MDGQIIIKDKETGEILFQAHVWAIYLLLTFAGEVFFDRQKINIFMDEKLIPMPEGLGYENNDPP